MKITFIILFTIFYSISCDQPVFLYVAGTDVNVRSCPSFSCNVVGQIRSPKELRATAIGDCWLEGDRIFGASNHWIFIRAISEGTSSGWVPEVYLSNAPPLMCSFYATMASVVTLRTCPSTFCQGVELVYSTLIFKVICQINDWFYVITTDSNSYGWVLKASVYIYKFSIFNFGNGDFSSVPMCYHGTSELKTDEFTGFQVYKSAGIDKIDEVMQFQPIQEKLVSDAANNALKDISNFLDSKKFQKKAEDLLGNKAQKLVQISRKVKNLLSHVPLKNQIFGTVVSTAIYNDDSLNFGEQLAINLIADVVVGATIGAVVTTSPPLAILLFIEQAYIGDKFVKTLKEAYNELQKVVLSSKESSKSLRLLQAVAAQDDSIFLISKDQDGALEAKDLLIGSDQETSDESQQEISSNKYYITITQSTSSPMGIIFEGVNSEQFLVVIPGTGTASFDDSSTLENEEEEQQEESEEENQEETNLDYNEEEMSFHSSLLIENEEDQEELARILGDIIFDDLDFKLI